MKVAETYNLPFDEDAFFEAIEEGNAQALIDYHKKLRRALFEMYQQLANGINNSDLIDRGDPSDFDFTLTDFTTDGNWHDLDLSDILPEGAYAVVLFVGIEDDLAGQHISFRKNGNSNEKNWSRCFTQVSNIGIINDLTVFCDPDRKIEYQATNTTWTTINVTIKGWWV